MHCLANIRFDSQQCKTQNRSQNFRQIVLASMLSPFTFWQSPCLGHQEVAKQHCHHPTLHPRDLHHSRPPHRVKYTVGIMLERRKPSTSYRRNLPSRKPFSHSSDNSGPPCRRNWSKDKDGSVVDKSSRPRTGLVTQGSCPHLELNLTPAPWRWIPRVYSSSPYGHTGYNSLGFSFSWHIELGRPHLACSAASTQIP